MKCPICGDDLKTDILENPVMISFWCEKGHFGTDYYRQPSNAINEALSMIRATLDEKEKDGYSLDGENYDEVFHCFEPQESEDKE